MIMLFSLVFSGHVFSLYSLWVSAAPRPSSVVCISSETPELCNARGLQFREKLHVKGSCPGCTLSLGNENCTAPQVYCNLGYKCDELSGTCVPDAEQVCAAANTKANATLGSWIANCTADGMYAKKQCKGEAMAGKCFCSDPQGNRIFGEAKWILGQSPASMCECSGLVWELQKTHSDVSVHCDDEGKFEKVQCDEGVCWCARAFDGTAYTSIVSEEMMKSLPCYDLYTNGDKYLRTCDSIHMAQKKTLNILKIHGTDDVAFNPVNCNYDGSYAKVQRAKNANGKICASKANTQIWDFVIPEDAENVTCNCAYDRFISDETFNLQCDRNGEYEFVQLAGGQHFCVDPDGFSTPCSVMRL